MMTFEIGPKERLIVWPDDTRGFGGHYCSNRTCPRELGVSGHVSNLTARCPKCKRSFPMATIWGGVSSSSATYTCPNPDCNPAALPGRLPVVGCADAFSVMCDRHHITDFVSPTWPKLDATLGSSNRARGRL